jgi:hypothetical protein
MIDIVSRLNDVKPGDVIPSSGSDAIATVVADLAALRKALADAITAGYIPTYDQRRLNDVCLRRPGISLLPSIIVIAEKGYCRS